MENIFASSNFRRKTSGWHNTMTTSSLVWLSQRVRKRQMQKSFLHNFLRWQRRINPVRHFRFVGRRVIFTVCRFVYAVCQSTEINSQIFFGRFSQFHSYFSFVRCRRRRFGFACHDVCQISSRTKMKRFCTLVEGKKKTPAMLLQSTKMATMYGSQKLSNKLKHTKENIRWVKANKWHQQHKATDTTL